MTDTDRRDVDEMMERFAHGYNIAFPHFERMERTQQAYGNRINTFQWPTISEIGVPLTFIQVEEQLPFAMRYLFPERKRFIRMIPSNAAMDVDQIRRLEDNMRYTIVDEMDSATTMLPSIKDCYKFGVGYGLVDVVEVTPPSVDVNLLFREGEVLAEAPQMVTGERKRLPAYRYLSPIQVVPMGDGANVDGQGKASGHFVVLFYYEDELRQMYRNQRQSDGKPFLMGDIDTIVSEAKNFNFDSRTLPADMIRQLSGLPLTETNNADHRIPVVIPVIRCYFDNWQMWIANGRTKIWEQRDNFQTLSSDLVKWSAWPEGKHWFPFNPMEASESLNLGQNVWYNAIVDLMQYTMNPTRVLNTSMMATNKSAARGPGADIEVKGDVRTAAQYLATPQVPQQVFAMGDTLAQLLAKTHAQPFDRGTPGLVRGGANALETMVQSSTGRQLLAAATLKTGGLKAAIQKTLIKKQMLIGESGQEKFIDTETDPETGDEFTRAKTITIDELRNIFRIRLNMPVATLNSAAALAERTAYFDRAQQNPELFRQRELYEELTDDEPMVTRTMKPKAETERLEAEMTQAELNARAAGAGRGAQQPAIAGAQQALAGAANIGGQA